MRARILVADDHPLVRIALRNVLENAGPWEVIEATDGEEAIAQAQAARPDLVILDLAMPVMDGFTAVALLKKILPDAPILVHTLYFSPLVVKKALKAGARKVVPKSNSAMIVAAVQELLGSGSEGSASGEKPASSQSESGALIVAMPSRSGVATETDEDLSA